ncbi:uncharacterized protein KY384_004698 [Bacidia gigantensis]|uniref:uncharacterized protein n=1 Tax=Bacidia gigantensis TaxID=2732470 RepID=UPI001D055BBB|nr:uncharacterized protein KY384_004698 [Bacidia gigantensis]KAG8530198.1 hypothetical protein KY384_004698 [Bacidia gigantensis]
MASLDRLPPELINKIVDLIEEPDKCPQKHLSRLRLVTRALNAVATPRVFAVMPLWIGLQSLTYLDNVAKRSKLSKFVTKIAFDPIRMIVDYDEEELRGKMKDYFECRKDRLNDSAFALGRYLSSRKDYASKQRFLDFENTDRKILTRTLRLLPNLRAIDIIVPSISLGGEELLKSFGRLCRLDFSQDFLRQSNVLLKAIEDTEISLDALHLLASEEICPLRKMENGCYPTQVQTLPKNTFIFELDSSQWRKFSHSENLASKMLPSLKDLRFLVPVDADLQEFNTTCDSVRFVLGKNLGVSKLGVAAHYRANVIRDERTRLLRDIMEIKFDGLQTLHLCGLRVDNLSEVAQFFSRLNQGLVAVHFGNVIATKNVTGNWSELLASLSILEWKSLKSFKLTECVKKERELDIAPFLKNGTTMPQLDEILKQ